MAADTTSINQVRLLQLVRDARLFGEIAIGELDIWEACLRLLVDVPAHDTHLAGIAKPSGRRGNRVFLVRAMDAVMTRLAEREQVLRAVPTGLA